MPQALQNTHGELTKRLMNEFIQTLVYMNESIHCDLFGPFLGLLGNRADSWRCRAGEKSEVALGHGL
jgi:hypothetical protein